ncbi:hypothetical protein V8C35DRAFT_260732 [Trichoderma chlorosporum]
MLDYLIMHIRTNLFLFMSSFLSSFRISLTHFHTFSLTLVFFTETLIESWERVDGTGNGGGKRVAFANFASTYLKSLGESRCQHASKKDEQGGDKKSNIYIMYIFLVIPSSSLHFSFLPLVFLLIQHTHTHTHTSTSKHFFPLSSPLFCRVFSFIPLGRETKIVYFFVYYFVYSYFHMIPWQADFLLILIIVFFFNFFFLFKLSSQRYKLHSLH